MKRFGYYIRLGGDPEIREALRKGDVAALQPVPRASSEAVRRVAMMKHTPEEWARMTRRARRKYRPDRMPEGIGGALLVGYAMVCYGAQVGFDWLWEAIEGRRKRWRG